MPTYEYQCGACGHQFEKFHSITAEPIKVCPECNKKKVKRLIGTGAGLIFKGSGFYITDYRSDSYKSAAKSESSGTSGSSGKSESAGTSGASGSGSGATGGSSSSGTSGSGGTSGSTSTSGSGSSSGAKTGK